MRPRLWTAWVHTFWDVFDHLGFWFIANWICLLSLPLGVFFPVVLSGLLKTHGQLMDGREPSITAFYKNCVSVFWPAFLLGLLNLGVLVLGGLNAFFYWTHFGNLGKFLVLATFFCLVFWKVILFFAFPMLCHHRRLRNILAISFSLAVKHFGFALLVFLVSSLIIFVCAVTVVGFLFLFFSIQFVFWGNAFDQVRRVEEKLKLRPVPQKSFRELFFPFHP